MSADRKYEPKQAAKPLDDLVREFYVAGKGSSGPVKSAAAKKDVAAMTAILDLTVPEGALWKLRRALCSGHSDLEFEVLAGKAGAETLRAHGDAKERETANAPLEDLPVAEKEKVLVRMAPKGGSAKTMKATLFYEELT